MYILFLARQRHHIEIYFVFSFIYIIE